MPPQHEHKLVEKWLANTEIQSHVNEPCAVSVKQIVNVGNHHNCCKKKDYPDTNLIEILYILGALNHLSNCKRVM